jgi:hypothetical protein
MGSDHSVKKTNICSSLARDQRTLNREFAWFYLDICFTHISSIYTAKYIVSSIYQVVYSLAGYITNDKPLAFREGGLSIVNPSKEHGSVIFNTERFWIYVLPSLVFILPSITQYALVQ